LRIRHYLILRAALRAWAGFSSRLIAARPEVGIIIAKTRMNSVEECP